MCQNVYELFGVVSHLINRALGLRARVVEVAIRLQGPVLPLPGCVTLGHLVIVYLSVPKFSQLKTGTIIVPRRYRI